MLTFIQFCRESSGKIDAPDTSRFALDEQHQQRRVKMLSEAEQKNEEAVTSAESETEKRQAAINRLLIKLAGRKR